MPSNVLPLGLKQIFPPIIWIFTEGGGDKIESRLPFKIFFTLQFQFQKDFSLTVCGGQTENQFHLLICAI